MSARIEMQEAVGQLLEKIIAYNRSKYREYFEMSSEIQEKYDIHDYADMLAHLRHTCDDLSHNKEFINGLSDSELVTIGQILLSTAKEIGLDTPILKPQFLMELLNLIFRLSVRMQALMIFYRPMVLTKQQILSLMLKRGGLMKQVFKCRR